MKDLFCDSARNRGNIKGRLVMFLFRLAAWCRQLPAPLWYFTLPYLVWYELVVVWSLGIELRYRTKIGPGLALYHGVALVVHEGATIGANCTLRQSTTIGAKQLADGSQSACPVLGDGVDVGANVVIIGPVKVGDFAVIGAGSVVVKDVPARAVVAGNPARLIRQG
jgi:putative colanic acid biosynthesis acetyltransferase WcaB